MRTVAVGDTRLAGAAGDHLATHLSLVPAHRALVRALEARLFEGVALPGPILDVGCGDGLFARASLPLPVDVGVDPSADAVAACARLGVYREVRQASGARLPFEDGAFGSVVSNCVLEHVVEIDRAIHEIGRVLRPGGVFVGTMVTDRFPSLLGVPRILRRMGLRGLGERYARWFNTGARHHNMLAIEDWVGRLRGAGLEVERKQTYLGARAMLVFDLLHYYALPSLVVRAATGRWLLWEHPANVAPLAAALRPIYAADASEPGSCVFVVARRR